MTHPIMNQLSGHTSDPGAGDADHNIASGQVSSVRECSDPSHLSICRINQTIIPWHPSLVTRRFI